MAAELMRISWRAHPGGALDYSPEFFQACLTYPSDLPVIAPAYCDGSDLVAMVFGLPRRLVLNGKEANLLLMTFFTVAEEHKGRGLGHAIWSECLRQARDAGYDGAFHYCAEGNISNHVTVSAATRSGYFVTRVCDVPFLSRLIRKAPARASENGASPAEFVAAASHIPAGLTLTRQWTAEEAKWQCSRPNAIAVASDDGAGAGAISGYCAPVLDNSGMRCAVIDDVLCHSLPHERRAALLSQFVDSAAAAGADLITVPALGYVDPGVFQSVGFRKTRRILHAYLTRWTDEPSPPFSGMYLDVI